MFHGCGFFEGLAGSSGQCLAGLVAMVALVF
jgi:hypothetical protein